MHDRFGVRYETVKCHGYSNEIETQTLPQAKSLLEPIEDGIFVSRIAKAD